MGKFEEVLEEGLGPRVPRSKGSKVQGSQGPRYLKLTFKYKLDSKEGQPLFHYYYFHYSYGGGHITNILRILKVR